jgi:hypothetical protein
VAPSGLAAAIRPRPLPFPDVIRVETGKYGFRYLVVSQGGVKSQRHWLDLIGTPEGEERVKVVGAILVGPPQLAGDPKADYARAEAGNETRGTLAVRKGIAVQEEHDIVPAAISVLQLLYHTCSPARIRIDQRHPEER